MVVDFYVDAALQGCGEMRILKIPYALRVGLDLWQCLKYVLYYGCQIYRHILLFLPYILQIWRFQFFRDLIPLKRIIKEVLSNLGMNSKNL